METRITIRIPTALAARLEALAIDPPADLAVRGKVKSSTLAREAMIRGLEVLERERKRERQEGK